MQDVLQAAGQYRETKASVYRAAENAAAEPEYIPWTGVNAHTPCFLQRIQKLR